MPNTLAHIGLQTVLTRVSFPKTPLQWITLGCIIPDVPWIVQRILLATMTIDPVNLRLYTVIQTSLLYCAVLSLAFAVLTDKVRFIFLILAANSTTHLILDACQTKWGNGIYPFAPFSWQTFSFELFWPEHFISYILSFAGLAVLLYHMPGAGREDLFFAKPGIKKSIVLTTSLLFYTISPFFFTDNAINADLYYSKTIYNQPDRTGKTIEIDRGIYNSETQHIRFFGDTELTIVNPPPVASGLLSIRGIFTSTGGIIISEYHQHNQHRDYASYLGLILTIILWLHPSLLSYFRTNK